MRSLHFTRALDLLRPRRGAEYCFEYSGLLDWLLSFYLLFVLGFLDSEEGSLLSFKVCFLRLPEFLKAQISVLHKSEFLEQAPRNVEDDWH